MVMVGEDHLNAVGGVRVCEGCRLRVGCVTNFDMRREDPRGVHFLVNSFVT